MKKIMAVLTVVLMLFQCIPIAALASDNLQELTEQLEAAFTSFNELIYPDATAKILRAGEMEQKLLDCGKNILDTIIAYITAQQDENTSIGESSEPNSENAQYKEKAQELGVPVLTEEELEAMLDE